MPRARSILEIRHDPEHAEDAKLYTLVLILSFPTFLPLPPNRNPRHGQAFHQLRRDQIAEPVLARFGSADRQGTNVVRAFRAGWGGVVWKTLGEQGPPVVNVSGPRYGAWHSQDRRVQGFNNIELITDRRWRSTCARSSRSSATGRTVPWSFR